MAKRYLIVISVLLLLSVTTIWLSSKEPSQNNALYAKELPMQVDGWTGSDFKVDEKTLQILETDDVLMREYKKDDIPPVELCVVFASNNRKVSHPPEVCYSGGGWSVEENQSISFSEKSDEYPDFKANKLIIEKGVKKQLVLYWYKCNKRYATNYYQQQINIAKSQLITGNSTSGLIRTSTIIENNDVTEAMMRLQEFSLTMLPYLTKHLP